MNIITRYQSLEVATASKTDMGTIEWLLIVEYVATCSESYLVILFVVA